MTPRARAGWSASSIFHRAPPHNNNDGEQHMTNLSGRGFHFFGLFRSFRTGLEYEKKEKKRRGENHSSRESSRERARRTLLDRMTESLSLLFYDEVARMSMNVT